MDEGFEFKDFLRFDRMIAPKVIRVVYWIGLVAITLGALGALFGGGTMAGAGMGGGIGHVLGVLLFFAVAVLLWRIIMEAYYVFFGIYDRLGEIRDRMGEDDKDD
ncbi:MAG: DUF4282 domain-containing protein [Alphaproteobacteria bacterium]|nr:MAG: DUF4282 domain-containing protein [Alphaproteobacteria bacterium]